MSRLYTAESAAEQLRDVSARLGVSLMYPYAIGVIGSLVGSGKPCEDIVADIATLVDAIDRVIAEMQDRAR